MFILNFKHSLPDKDADVVIFLLLNNDAGPAMPFGRTNPEAKIS